jgi:hypothetical protein
MSRASGGYAHVEGVVLYDIFCEAATLLGGRLVALQDVAAAAADQQALQTWTSEMYAVDDERDSIAVTDRDAQVAAIERWHVRRDHLGAHLTGSAPLGT